MGARETSTRGGRGWHALLLVPFVALLCVPLYARHGPELLGFPFFYWYQFAWGLLTIAIMAIVYRATRRPDPGPDGGDVHER